MEDPFYVKEGVELHEYKIHKFVYNLGVVNVPKVYNYDRKTKRMTMQRIFGDSLSDFYGENEKNISEDMFDQVRDIIQTLKHHNVIYVDITGYNFILDKNEKLWIIDFEHACYVTEKNEIPEFVEAFCGGENKWNSEFR